MNLTPTVNLVELAMFVLALLGLLVTIAVMPGVVWTTLLLRRKNINGIMRRSTHSDLREEGQRFYRLAGCTLFAGAAMTLMPAARAENRDVNTWFLLFLIFMVVGDTANAIVGAIDRTKNLRDAAKERRRDNAQGKRDDANIDNPDWSQLQEPESQSKPFFIPDQYMPTGEGENGH